MAEVVGAGFMDWTIPLFTRRLATMIPALVVLTFVSDSSAVLVDSQIVLSFGIPFALIPLLILSRDPAVMGHMVNRRGTTILMAVFSAIIIALNVALVGKAAAGAL